ncbi:MAG: hypothetical protein WCG83_06185 [Candidatus Peregrinibacteria bacterium]
MKSIIPLSGTQLYDALMASIEPELTTTELPLLEEKYKSETPEQAKIRAVRYTKAYAEYDKAYEAYMGDAKVHLSLFRKSAFQSLEAESRTKEASALSVLELQLLPATTAL